jgi:NitT/TauT family transport system substrate-binding protein/sulfonate transport system substrate-binding protein
MTRRTAFSSRISTAGALAIVTALALTACAPAQTTADQSTAKGADTITVKLGVLGATGRSTKEQLAGFAPTPLSFYYSEGLLESALADEGIELGEIVSPASGPASLTALQGGSVDVVVGVADSPLLQAVAGGVDLKILATTSVNSDAWLVTGPNGPSDVADLAGTTVGTSRGSYLDRYVIGVLAANGITQDEVHLADIQKPADAVPALERGDLSAYSLPPQIAIATRDQIGGSIISKASETNPELTATIFSVVSDPFLARHPDFPKRWNRVLQKAVDYTHEHSEAFIEYFTQAVGANLSDVKTYQNTDNYPDEPINDEIVARLRSTLDYLVAGGYVKSGSVDIDTLLAPGIEP